MARRFGRALIDEPPQPVFWQFELERQRRDRQSLLAVEPVLAHQLHERVGGVRVFGGERGRRRRGFGRRRSERRAEKALVGLAERREAEEAQERERRGGDRRQRRRRAEEERPAFNRNDNEGVESRGDQDWAA
jgi:hypothetical protein